MQTPSNFNASNQEAYSAVRMDHESRTPRVISLISLALERSIQKNEELLEKVSKKKNDVLVTVFHGSRPPSLSIKQYLERIFKYSCCSPSCFVLAYIYMDRFLQMMNFHLTSLNVHRLLITSVMVAAKFIDDQCYNNAYYAKVGGVSTLEMNRLEMDFLFNVDFRLHVTPQLFAKYCMQLENIGDTCKPPPKIAAHSCRAL